MLQKDAGLGLARHLSVESEKRERIAAASPPGDRVLRRSIWTGLAGLTLVSLSGCVDGADPAGVQLSEAVTLRAAPVFALVTTAAEIDALDLARITLRNSSDRAVVAEHEEPIDPSQPEWSFELTVQLTPGQILSLLLEFELVDSDGGVESVEFSGRTEAFTLHTSFQRQDLWRVDLHRGPLANLGLTGVTFRDSVLGLVRGASATLADAWDLQGDTAGAVMYLRVMDTSVVTLDANGRVRARDFGTTEIVVFGGQVADTLPVEVTDVTLPPLDELEATVMPQVDYVVSDLFIATFSDPVGATTIRDPMSALARSLRALDGPDAVDFFEGAVEAWGAYGAGTNLTVVDGPQLGVVELTLILVANALQTEFP